MWSVPRWREAFGTVAARGLSLAAAPTFAAMALLAANGSGSMVCMSGQGPLSLDGMVPMYVLMSAFHLAPWFRLMRSPSNEAERAA